MSVSRIINKNKSDILGIEVRPFKDIPIVDTDDEISTLNNWEKELNFGNPFGVNGWKDGALLKDKGTIEDVARLYQLWLQKDRNALMNSNITLEDLSLLNDIESKRDWIRGEIKKGYKGKTLLTNINNPNSYAYVLKYMMDGKIPLDTVKEEIKVVDKVSNPNNKEVDRVEYRFSTFVKASRYNPDTHIVKELITYKDGTTEPNLRLVRDFQRPFYITKDYFRDHKQKKEFEEVHKLQKYMSNESELANQVGRKSGRTGYSRNIMRDVRDSPFVYGIDVDSRVFLSKSYLDKYPGTSTPLSNCVLDIESDIETNTITLITIAMNRKIYTVATKDFLGKHNNGELKSKVMDLFDKNIPEVKIKGVVFDKKDVDIKLTVVDTPGQAVVDIMKTVHKWSPDVLSIWNMMFDIPMLFKALDREDIDHVDVFSDPSIPKDLRRCILKPGPVQSVKESGLVTPIDYHQQWHTLMCTSSFYVIDAMCTYNYVRAGANAVPGGYGLDNILKVELGPDIGKLKFTVGGGLVKADWHNYMSKNHQLEYLVYNIWDCLSMILLDEKTTDISVNLGILSGHSSFDKFSSGPKKIIDKLYFDAFGSGYVLGSKPSKVEDDKILGLSNWIITLEAFRIDDNGMQIINEDHNIHTNIKPHCFDLD